MNFKNGIKFCENEFLTLFHASRPLFFCKLLVGMKAYILISLYFS